MLQADLRTLLRFHRFLIQRGASSQLQEELQILGTYVASIILLSMLKTSVHAVGPFALSRTTRRARALVDKMSFTAEGADARARFRKLDGPSSEAAVGATGLA